MSGVTRLGLGPMLITKQNTSGQYRIGSAAVTAVNGTTAWSQVVASLTAESVVTAVHAVTTSASGFDQGSLDYVEVAIGASGSESSVATAPLYSAGTSSSSGQARGVIPVPNRVAAGQRVAVRLTAGAGLSSAPVTIYLFGVPYANIEGT